MAQLQRSIHGQKCLGTVLHQKINKVSQ